MVASPSSNHTDPAHAQQDRQGSPAESGRATAPAVPPPPAAQQGEHAHADRGEQAELQLEAQLQQVLGTLPSCVISNHPNQSGPAASSSYLPVSLTPCGGSRRATPASKARPGGLPSPAAVHRRSPRARAGGGSGGSSSGGGNGSPSAAAMREHPAGQHGPGPPAPELPEGADDSSGRAAAAAAAAAATAAGAAVLAGEGTAGHLRELPEGPAARGPSQAKAAAAAAASPAAAALPPRRAAAADPGELLPAMQLADVPATQEIILPPTCPPGSQTPPRLAATGAGPCTQPEPGLAIEAAVAAGLAAGEQDAEPATEQAAAGAAVAAAAGPSNGPGSEITEEAAEEPAPPLGPAPAAAHARPSGAIGIEFAAVVVEAEAGAGAWPAALLEPQVVLPPTAEVEAGSPDAQAGPGGATGVGGGPSTEQQQQPQLLQRPEQQLAQGGLPGPRLPGTGLGAAPGKGGAVPAPASGGVAPPEPTLGPLGPGVHHALGPGVQHAVESGSLPAQQGQEGEQRQGGEEGGAKERGHDVRGQVEGGAGGQEAPPAVQRLEQQSDGRPSLVAFGSIAVTPPAPTEAAAEPTVHPGGSGEQPPKQQAATGPHGPHADAAAAAAAATAAAVAASPVMAGAADQSSPAPEEAGPSPAGSAGTTCTVAAVAAAAAQLRLQCLHCGSRSSDEEPWAGSGLTASAACEAAGPDFLSQFQSLQGSQAAVQVRCCCCCCCCSTNLLRCCGPGAPPAEPSGSLAPPSLPHSPSCLTSPLAPPSLAQHPFLPCIPPCLPYK